MGPRWVKLQVAIEPQSLTEGAGGIATLQDTGGTGDTGSISDGVALTRLREAVEDRWSNDVLWAISFIFAKTMKTFLIVLGGRS